MRLLTFQYAQNFFFTHDDEVLAVNLDLGAGVLAEQNAIARLYVEREDLAFVVRFALTYRNDFTFLWLLFGRVRNDDSSTYRLAFVNATEEDAVVKGSEGGRYGCSCHCVTSPSHEGLPRGFQLDFRDFSRDGRPYPSDARRGAVSSVATQLLKIGTRKGVVKPLKMKI